jgi:hypothetical protein
LHCRRQLYLLLDWLSTVCVRKNKSQFLPAERRIWPGNRLVVFWRKKVQHLGWYPTITSNCIFLSTLEIKPLKNASNFTRISRIKVSPQTVSVYIGFVHMVISFEVHWCTRPCRNMRSQRLFL